MIIPSQLPRPLEPGPQSSSPCQIVIHLFIQIYSEPYHMPGTVGGARDTVLTKENPCFQGVYTAVIRNRERGYK